jgi:caffeoyl-CoA O-methyltransferase
MMSTQQTGLQATISKYLSDVTLKEAPLLAQLREETRILSGAHMQISPEQGQFMRLLVELMKARRCLEVGVYTGYSSLSVALGLKEGAELIACDIDPETTAIAERYWKLAGVARLIRLELRPAQETLRGLLNTGQALSFDFAFIDADKTSYDDYYELCLGLLRPGGLIAIDNALWDGKVADFAISDEDTVAIRDLNRKIVADPRVSSSLVPIGDGLHLVRKR